MNTDQTESNTNLLESLSTYKPSRMSLLREYDISIQFMSLGCAVQVGCKTIGFSNINEAMEAINEYVKNPFEVRQKWEERFKTEENN